MMTRPRPSGPDPLWPDPALRGGVVPIAEVRPHQPPVIVALLLACSAFLLPQHIHGNSKPLNTHQTRHKELVENVREAGDDPAAIAAARGALSQFYRHEACDIEREQRELARIVSLALPAKHSGLEAAKARLKELRSESLRFAAADKVIADSRAKTQDATVVLARIENLEGLIAGQLERTRLAFAQFYLAEQKMGLERFYDAQSSYETALELCPALDLALPATIRRDRAQAAWLRNDLKIGSRMALGLLGLLAAIAFFRSRPQRRLKLRHGVLLAVLAAVWTGTFFLIVPLAAAITDFELAGFPEPVVLFTGIKDPLSDALRGLYAHGLAGIVFVFVAAFSTAHWKRHSVRVLANAVLSTVFFAALVTRFYLSYEPPEFKSPHDADSPLLEGAAFYPMTGEQAPFLLTDPLAFCPFQKTVQSLDEPAVASWFQRFAPLCEEQR